MLKLRRRLKGLDNVAKLEGRALVQGLGGGSCCGHLGGSSSLGFGCGPVFFVRILEDLGRRCGAAVCTFPGGMRGRVA